MCGVAVRYSRKDAGIRALSWIAAHGRASSPAVPWAGFIHENRVLAQILGSRRGESSWRSMIWEVEP